VGNLNHAPHLVDDADLDDEVDARGDGNEAYISQLNLQDPRCRRKSVFRKNLPYLGRLYITNNIEFKPLWINMAIIDLRVRNVDYIIEERAFPRSKLRGGFIKGCFL